MEAICITAPDDGVAPAVLLSVPTSARKALGRPKPAQYLFNVPEGLSRLALEHHFRPGAGLRAVCVTGTLPEASGGWGGLLMRLSQDGHGHVTLVGPPGLAEEVCLIGSIVKWRHPTVQLQTIQLPASQHTKKPAATTNNEDRSAVAPAGCNLAIGTEHVVASCCYEDDLVHVMALWSHDQGQGQLPDWLTHSSKLCQAPGVCQIPAHGPVGIHNIKDTSDTSDSSDETSDSNSEGSSSDDGISDSASNDATSNDSSSSEDADSSSDTSKESDSSSSSSNDSSSSDRSNSAAMVNRDLSEDHKFDVLDKMFLEAGQAGRAQLRNPGRGMQHMFSGPGRRGAAGMLHGPNRQEILQALRQHTKPPNRSQQQPVLLTTSDDLLHHTTAASSLHLDAKRSQQTKQSQQNKLPHANTQQSKARGMQAHSKAISTHLHTSTSIMGYLCHECISGHLVLVLAVSDIATTSSILSHPVITALMTDSGLKQCVAMVIHLSSSHVVQQTAYQAVMRELPGKQVVVAGKPCNTSLPISSTKSQLTSGHTNSPQPAEPNLRELGFYASARTLAKLHLLDKDIFPLPAPAASMQPPVLLPIHSSTQNSSLQQDSDAQMLAHQDNQLEGIQQPVVVTTSDRHSHDSHIIQGSLLTRVSIVRQKANPGTTSNSSTKTAANGLSVGVQEYDKQLDLETVWQDLLTSEHASQLCDTLKELHAAIKELCSNSPARQQTPVPKPDSLQTSVIMQNGQHSTGYESVQMHPHASVHATMTVQQEQQTQHVSASPFTRHTEQYLMPASKRMRHNCSHQTHCVQSPESNGVHIPTSGSAHRAPSNRNAAADIRQRLRHKEQQKPPERIDQPPTSSVAKPETSARPAVTDCIVHQPLHLLAQQICGVSNDMTQPIVSKTKIDRHQPIRGLQTAALLHHLKDDMQNVPLCLRMPESKDTRVVFLGTGSAEPSKYRGPSAILLQLSGKQGCIMMDCGEGTWGALSRSMGQVEAIRVVGDLRCLFISHRHADHCLGLVGLLAARPAGALPLLVVGPTEVQAWLQHLSTAHGFKTTFVHCKHFHYHQTEQQHHVLGCGPQGCGLLQWQTVRVHHCHDAYGLVLVHKQGWKLVYSGDTRPCKELIQAGMGATLLIHEATFEPKLIDQALQKRHSTSSEALEVATAMKAYRTILTHFSQRYSKLPAGLGLTADSDDDTDGLHHESLPVGQECNANAGNVHPTASPGSTVVGSSMAAHACALEIKLRSASIAFDGMTVSLSSLPWLPALNPFIKTVLQDTSGQLAQAGHDS